MMDKLLNLAKEILDSCSVILKEQISPNVDVVRIIKSEFEKQYNSIYEVGKLIVLNKKRDLWASRIITDSANLNFDKNLFELVFKFSELCRKAPSTDLIVLYN